MLKFDSINIEYWVFSLAHKLGKRSKKEVSKMAAEPLELEELVGKINLWFILDQ